MRVFRGCLRAGARPASDDASGSVGQKRVADGGASTSEPAWSSHETYIGVQILRGLAALLVVVFHAGLMVQDRIPGLGDEWVLRFGAAGVDIFFPISGFVMVISTRALLGRRDGWRSFARRRIIRIVPLYWLATTAKILAVLAVPALALRTELSWWHSVASYLFVFVPDSNGSVQPVVPVGWTLNYEMFFYALMAAVIFSRRPLVPTLAGLLLLVAAASAFVPASVAPLTVFNPIVLEFLAGMWIAVLVSRGLRLSPAGALGVAVLALTMLAATDRLEAATVEHWRLLAWGLPGAALLYAAVSLEPGIAARRWRFARLLGDASYALYLSHGFVLPVCAVVLARAGWAGPAAAALAFGVAILASVAVGIATHLWIERPMTDWLMRRRYPTAAPVPVPMPPATGSGI